MNTLIYKISGNSSEDEVILKSAAEVIKNGGLVVFPTETVYGLGADATNASAAASIYSAKGRPSDNPLIIHIAKPEDAEKYTYINDTYRKLAERFMPGPLTVVLPAKDIIPMQTRASLPTVAVRCPEHPVASKLIALSGVPIAAPSANLSGSPSPTKAEHVINDMMGRVDVIIDGGNSDFGLESTIVKIDSDDHLTLLRPGKITVEDLLQVCKNVTIASAVTAALAEGETVLSPGMKYRHYAPKGMLTLIDGGRFETSDYVNDRAKSKSVALLCYEDDLSYFEANCPNVYLYKFGIRGDEATSAHILFDILRNCDERGFEEIYAPLPRKEGIGLALFNRMIRAAAYNIIKI